MPTIQQVRDALQRTVEESGRVRDMDLSAFKKSPVTVGEVVSLSPPKVELLNGETVPIRLRTAGLLPAVGDIVLMNRIGPVLIAVDVVEVI